MPRIWLCLLVPAALSSQKPGRKIEGELAGNVFFGNTRQTLASTRAEFERADSGSAFRVLGRFNYGELTSLTTNKTEVSKRSWNAGSNFDWRPYADLTPFVKANVEASLENKIARRYTLSSGMRYNIVRTTATDLIFSAGAGGEQTTALPPGDSAGVQTLARGTTTLRLRRDFTPRLTFGSETTYGPALTTGDDYTILSINTLKTRIARFAALTLTFRDNYDSKAVLRGARVYNDGELLVGILTTF
jgi:hypothetical protein